MRALCDFGQCSSELEKRTAHTASPPPLQGSRRTGEPVCRTKRDWQPNVQYKFLHSECLNRKLRLFVTAHTLKRIDKAGGLDMYILTEPVACQASIVCEELRTVIVAVRTLATCTSGCMHVPAQVTALASVPFPVWAPSMLQSRSVYASGTASRRHFLPCPLSSCQSESSEHSRP